MPGHFLIERQRTEQILTEKHYKSEVREAFHKISASDLSLDIATPLRVLAITAPQFVAGQVGCMALSSGDAASLHNACRYAAYLAETGDPSWSASNWNTSRRARRESVLLLHDMDHAIETLADVLPTLRPNLVLIGTMSICMPGAIAVARIVRNELGDDVLIVLGGRHVNETVYDVRGKVAHHAASPLRLMASERIAPLFDLVVAGDGEAIIAEIGRSVASTIANGKPARDARFELNRLLIAPGKWLVGTVDDSIVHVVHGQTGPLNYEMMPSPAEMFGVGASFSIFGDVPTAHVFSDIGRGCIYDCAFCSERISVVGAPRDFNHSAERLYRNLATAKRVINEDASQASGASAFCEDSTLLGWRGCLVDRFCELVDDQELDIRFGGQATIDQILRNPHYARKLRKTGLEYLFIGIETPIPEKVGGFSKDIGHAREGWLDRSARAFDMLANSGIKIGVSLLFGLGEGLAERDLLFRFVEQWKCHLDTISMNWAVQHPLMNQDGGLGYEYLTWAIDPGPLLDVLRHFGEASTKYTISGGQAPSLSEARDIVDTVASLRGVNY